MIKKIAIGALLLQAVLPAMVPALGGAPQAVLPIYAGPELDYQPAIIRIQPDGRLLVVFERIRLADFFGDFYVTFSSDNGLTWSPPQPAIASARNERHPALVQLGPDSFALFYLVDETGSGSYRLHRATSSDAIAWTDQGPLDLGWATPGEINPCVIREADGTLTMTYHRLSGPSYIAQSTDDGATWDTLKTQVSPANAQLPRLVKRERDGLYLVTYQVGGSNLDIYAKTSTDPYNWSGPQVPISTEINSHDSQPIVLEDGTFLVAYAMTPVSYFDLFYRTSADGLAWSDEVQVTDDRYFYNTQPHPLLHGALGHIILTWSHQVSAQPYQDHDVYIETDLLIPADLSPSAKEVAPAVVAPAGLLTYTLLLANAGPGPTVAVLSDPIPGRATYAGGLWASGGAYGYDAGHNLITWTGALSAYAAVTLTYRVAAAPDLGDGEVITNTARLTNAQGLAVTLVASAAGDALPPFSTIADPRDGQIISGTAYLVRGTAGDTVGIAAVAVSVDRGAWQPVVGTEDWSYAWSGLADGPHHLRSRAVDLAGHVEVPGPGITVTVDATAPELVAHRPADGALDVPVSAAVVLTFGEAIVTGTLAYAAAPDPGGWAASWDAPATVVTLTHGDFAYAQPYTFTVLQAHDRAGNPLAPVTWSFATEERPCDAAAILTITAALSGCQVAFGAAISGTQPLAYLWDFGFQTSTHTNPLVDFGAGGTYPYTLTVFNCGVYSDTAVGTVTVACAPPCVGPAGADFVHAPAEPRVQATVHFSASVLGGTAPFTYSWAFGDGGMAMGRYATHVFAMPGAHTTTLVVANGCGQDSRQRVVWAVPYRIYLPLVAK